MGVPSGVLSPRPGLHLGRFNFHGGISGTVSYDDLVAVDNSGTPESDVTWMLSPYGSVGTEGPNDRSVRAFYSPGFLFFTDHSEFNSVNHSGTFDLQWPLNRLTLSLTENVNVASTVVRDVANRATQMTFSTLASAQYEVSHRTSVQGVFTYDRYAFDNQVEGSAPLIGSQSFGQQLWGDYHWTDKFSTGLGVSISELDVEEAPLQTAESPEVRVRYNPKPELSFMGSVGLQFRQFESGQSSSLEPIMSLSGSYTPRPGTVLSLDAQRAEYASGLNAGQNYVNTSFSASINQLFLRRFTANLRGGYTYADYVASEPGAQVNRTDSYYFIHTGVNWNMTDAWTMGLFYDHTGNSSSGDQFSYDHNVVGLQASWSF